MTQKTQRQRHYASLNICRHKLGWDEKTYRGYLRDHGALIKGNRYSASTMDDLQLARAVRDIRALVDNNNINDWRKGLIAKITAVWITMAEAGVIKNRSEMAMRKFCARYIKTAKLEWADRQELNHIIETLKQWAAREGVKLKQSK